MSDPLNTIISWITGEGGISFPSLRPSVPNDFTFCNAILWSFGFMLNSVPSYRIPDTVSIDNRLFVSYYVDPSGFIVVNF